MQFIVIAHYSCCPQVLFIATNWKLIGIQLEVSDCFSTRQISEIISVLLNICLQHESILHTNCNKILIRSTASTKLNRWQWYWLLKTYKLFGVYYAPLERPHSHILMIGGESKRDFLGVWKMLGFFWVAKKHRDYFGHCIFHKLKSTST